MPALIPPDPQGLPLMITRAQAHAAGITDSRIRRLLSDGRWSRLAPGTYLRTWSLGDDHVDRHEATRLLHCQRALAASGRREFTALGMGSAAAAHDLPLVSGIPQQIELLVPHRGWEGTRAGVRTHHCDLSDEDLVVLTSRDGDEMLVTSVARTWVDLARSGSLADALSAGDAALRRGMTTTDELERALERLGSARGRRRALIALRHLDPRRESALESGSAARFIEWGLPQPRLQHTFHDVRGPIARSDFDWPDHAVIGFADGMAKYADNPRRDRSERLQESRLRMFGTVARWGWADMAGDGRGLYYLISPLLGVYLPLTTARGRNPYGNVS